MTEHHSPQIINDFDSAEDYAVDYLRTYFMGEPTPDDQALISFLTERYSLLKGKPVLLEIGCGPVVNHILSAAPYVSEIHMADYRSDSLQQIQKWLDEAPDAHDWHRFTRYVLKLEGVIDISNEDVRKRELLLRASITKLLRCDIRQAKPLGYAKRYAAVACFYTTEQASSTIEEWHSVMRNLASLVEPGGDLFTCAMGNCEYYILYDGKGNPKKYPVPRLAEDDFRKALSDSGFDPENMLIRYQKLEGQESEGVFGVILVHARKKSG